MTMTGVWRDSKCACSDIDSPSTGTVGSIFAFETGALFFMTMTGTLRVSKCFCKEMEGMIIDSLAIFDLDLNE